MRIRVTLALLAALLALTVAASAFAQTGSYKSGYLFVSVGNGIIRAFDSGGNEVGELDTQTSSSEIGDMCFAPGAMYSMNFTDESISKFDGQGNLVAARWATIPGAIESCVFDSSGNLYVGEDGDTGGQLVKVSPDGQVAKTYTPAIDSSGVDQIDLAADQCTMYYTSEGSGIKRYDVCRDQQLPDFATGIGNACYGLRIRPNGEVLVACDVTVYRLSQSGTVIQAYSPQGASTSVGGLFALNLDNDDKHFFTATYQEGRIWRVDIDSGAGVDTPYLQTTIAGASIGGLAIFGEITVAAPSGVSSIDADRPEIVQKVPDPTQISTEPDVVGTNVAFSIIAVVIVLLSAQLFNETIEENNQVLEGLAKRYVRPLAAPYRGARSIWRGLLTGNERYAPTAAIAVVLVATAIVYGFLEPGFELNKDGVLLVIALVISLGAVTYAYSGMEARITERRFHLASGVRVFPVATGIAVMSVLVSRLVQFQPGLIFGFVASNVIFAGGDLSAKQKGQAVFLSGVCVLACFGAAWALMVPARDWADSDANVLAVLLEAAATMTVVGAIESLALSLVPIEFTHGMSIWRWSKAAWALLAFVSAFLFWHVLIVQDKAGFKAVKHDASLGAFAALAFCVGVTAAFWGYFYYRRKQEEKLAAAADAPAPAMGMATVENEAGVASLPPAATSGPEAAPESGPDPTPTSGGEA